MSVRDGKRRQRDKEEKSPKIDHVSTDSSDDVVKDIIKGRTGEQERIQQKVFAKWINSRFAKVNNSRRIEDLFQDLRTGVNLAALVELVTGSKIVVEKGKTRLHHVCNITKALEVLEQHEIKLVNVSADDIEDGNSKLTLSLTWAIIQQYYVKRLGGTVSDLRINNLEKTLLCWCQLATKGYPHVDVKNLHTSWTDGLAFNALIHKYREDLFDYSALLNNTAEVNLTHAFNTAEQQLDVPRLLEPEDILQGTPDQKSIVTYLLCLLEALPHEAMEVKALASVVDLDSTAAGGDSDVDGNYQNSAENVLAWMLSVEEKLDRGEISDSLERTIFLWNEHEALLSELSVQKNTVQLILDHGAKLLQSSRSKSKQAQPSQVENTMTVLTEKWENLQIKSTERTKLLRKMLSILQIEHIRSIDAWLSNTEKRMSLLKGNASCIESMDAQLLELSKLQEDLEKQLKVMNELMHFLFVGENDHADDIESTLMGLSKRWDDVCHWTEYQWTFIRRIRDTYDDFLKLCNECSDWISGRIELLQGLPTVEDDRLDWIHRNLDLLREMHDQMLDYQEKIQILQEKSDSLLSYFTPQTSVGMLVRRREEKICAEWNDLVDLLEVWTSNTDMRFEKSDALRSSKFRHSKRYSDNVDSSVPASSQPNPEENEPKTKKARQESEADEGLLENCEVLMDWLKMQQRALGMDSGQAKSPVADRSLMSQVSEELRGKDAEYKSLRMLAEDIIMEKRAANAPFEEIENKLNELASLWNNLTWTLGAGGTSPLLDQDEENFTHNLEVLEDVLISCRKTVERFDHDKEPPPNQIDQNLDDCKDRIHLMQINQVRISETAALVKKITDQGLAMSDIEIPWIEFCNRWNQTQKRLIELEANFTALKENQPTRTFLGEMDALKNWTSQLHKQLMDEQALHPTYLDKMTEQLQNYQDIQQAVTERQPSLERANSPPRQLVEKLIGTDYQKELMDLNAQWKDILQYLQHNSDNLSKWCEDLRAFEIDTDGLKQWMADVDSFLRNDIEAVGDEEAFVAMQEQFRGLEEDIKVLAPTTEKLLEAGRAFLRTNQEDFASSVKDSLKDIEDQWSSICTRAARQLQHLSLIATKRGVQSGHSDSEFEEINRIRNLLPNLAKTESLEFLENSKKEIQNAKALIKEKRDNLKSKISSDGQNGQQFFRESEDDQHNMERVLLEVEKDCEKKEKFLENFTEKWTTLSGCLSDCNSWMDEVEKLLSAAENAGDENSRRRCLTELNDFMSTQDYDKYSTIAELAEDFDKNQILLPLVKSEVDKMRTRLSRLSKRVSEQQQQNASIRTDSRNSATSVTSATSATSETTSGGEVSISTSLFSENLEKVTVLLSNLQAKLPSVELKTFDSVVIKSQLEECVLLYKKLSEIKGEVESLIKQGRQLVEADPAKPESEGLSRRLDTMKTQYNQMGAQVTATKAELDNGLKLVKKAEKEVDSLKISMDEMDAALAELDKLGDLTEYADTLKDLKGSVRQREETVNNLRTSHQQMRELAMKSNVPGFELKYTQQMQRWNKMQARLRTLQSPDKENIPQAISSAEIKSRNGLAAARSEFFGQHVTTTDTKQGTKTTVFTRETTTVTRVQLEASSPAFSATEPGNLLRNYQMALREATKNASDELSRNLAEGMKAEKPGQNDSPSQSDQLEMRIENWRRLEKMIEKFDSENSRITENVGKLALIGEEEKRSSDLEILKKDVSVNETLQKEILTAIDALAHQGNLTFVAGDGVSIDAENVKREIINKGSSLRQGLETAEQTVNAVQPFYKLLNEDFLIWLPKAESVAVSLLNEKAAESDHRFKRLIEERDSRIGLYDNIMQAGNGILANLDETSDGSAVQNHIDTVSQRWTDLNGKITSIRNASAVYGEDIESYLIGLDESIKWVKRKQDELMTMHPSGDRAILQKLHNYHHLFRAKLEAEKPKIDGILLRGRELTTASSAEQHRKTQNFNMAELSERVKMLSESWQSLFRESDALQHRTESVTAELDSLLKLCDSVRVKMDDLQTESNKWEDTDDVSVDDLAKRVEETKKFKTKVDAQDTRLEEVNALAARLQRTPSGLSEEVVRSVAYLNDQKRAFSDKVDDRLAQLQAGLDDLTSSDNQHFLATSVDEPWERRVGPNKVPYYINHQEQLTQWDHPRLTDMISSLLEVNQIRFSAYRTATKLRLMQKKLHLDLLHLPAAIEIFDKCGLRAQNDNTLDCTQAVTCLMVIYDRLNSQHPHRINFAVAIDVCLNWLLNCHDPERTGQLRVLAFKVSIVVLCQGELNAKYRYLFRLISDENGHADPQRLGQLLYSCVQIPRYLGEVAAFGGTDVDASVTSCFQFSTNGIDIQAKQFLAWLAREPQALVWMSVLHRLIAAESSKHHAKCNICECFPIYGLRYRCLKCFNFDLCQSCFFKGDRTKSHKLSHPMQEYCFPATSSEDMRDFKRVLKNKLRPRDSFRDSSKLGYLPVQSGSGRGGDHDKSSTLTSLNSNAKGSVGSSDPMDYSQARIVEVEGSRGPSSPEGDEEHNLITRYCNTLNGAPDSTQSTVQVLQAVEQEEKEEMENYLRQLQSDHDRLIAELEGVKQLHDDMSSEDMVAEASMLREDKGRLEARMKILEEHNRQLDSQLQRIKHLLEEAPARGTSTSPLVPSHSHTASVKFSESLGEDLTHHRPIPSRSPSSMSSSPSALKQTVRQQSNYSVGQLFHAAGSLNVAVGTLVTVMKDEESNFENVRNKNHKINGNSVS